MGAGLGLFLNWCAMNAARTALVIAGDGLGAFSGGLEGSADGSLKASGGSLRFLGSLEGSSGVPRGVTGYPREGWGPEGVFGGP